MSAFKQKSIEAFHKSVSEIPDYLQATNQFLEAKLSAGVGDVHAKFEKDLDLTKAAVNADLKALVIQVQDICIKANLYLTNFERFITIHIPQIQDGGNFGVEIQYAILKVIAEKKKELAEKMDSFKDYHAARSGLLKDLMVSDVTKKTSTDKNQSVKGGKEEEAGDKVIKGTTVEQVVSTNNAVSADAAAAISSLDTRWYFYLQTTTVYCSDAVFQAWNLMSENEQKIVAPRGG